MKGLKFTPLALLLLSFSPEAARADFSVGQRVPSPTAAGQSITSTAASPFTWTPVTLPYGLNGTGQMAVGGTVDATSRLSVNPQGTAENGLTVNMPNGATGNAFQVKDSTGTTTLSVNSAGGLGVGVSAANSYLPTAATTVTSANAPMAFDAFGAGNIEAQIGIGSFFGTWHGTYLNNVGLGFWSSNGCADELFLAGNSNGTIRYETRSYGLATGSAEFQIGNSVGDPSSASLIIGGSKIIANSPFLARNAALVPVTIQGRSGQTADLLDLNNSTGTVLAKVAATGVATFPAVQTATATKTAPYTLTATDTTILVNGAFAVTLPAASAALAGHSWTVKQIGAASSTLVGTIDGNTSGYTLAAQYNFCTFVCDGTAFYIVSKG